MLGGSPRERALRASRLASAERHKLGLSNTGMLARDVLRLFFLTEYCINRAREYDNAACTTIAGSQRPAFGLVSSRQSVERTECD